MKTIIYWAWELLQLATAFIFGWIFLVLFMCL